MASAAQRVQLIDEADGPGRTTSTLVASLTARLAALRLCSGADAIGSLTAGFAVLGREVSRTAEGARLRRALETSRAGHNGQALWAALQITVWLAGMPASPVIEQLRNDVALLLASDLSDVIGLLPIPATQSPARIADDEQPYTFLDCVLGLWAFSGELVRSVEALAKGTVVPANQSAEEQSPVTDEKGPLLR
jgi:hypothetical protein